MLDGHTVSPVGDNAIVPDRRVSRITKPESVIGKRSLVILENIAIRECGLEGVVRRETAIVSSDKIVIAGVSIVGPNEETVATVSQTVAHDPIAMGKLLQQDTCRVGSVVPETPSKTNAVVGSVVLDNVVAGR